MFHFWKIIHHILHMTRPTKIIEVGCLYGHMTEHIFNGYLIHVPQAQVYSVDPAPQFDISAMKERFRDSFTMIQDFSLRALPDLMPCDVILLDGDSNWYTVYHELKILETCERFPIVFLHDLAFPCARRDLYHFPDSIPQEHRKPYAQKLPVNGQNELSETSCDPSYVFATHEGGERNGTLTAIEDFLRETKRQLILHRIRSEYGLGILVSTESEQDRDWNTAIYHAIMSLKEEYHYVYSQYWNSI